MSDHSNNMVNTLRLGQRELHKLLEEFDQEQGNGKAPDREFVRWSFRVGAVDLTIQHTTGAKVTLPVATRNISKGGIAILHSAFIHTGSPCEVALNLPGGNSLYIAGKVVRCSHLQGRVHEIGIAFNEQISTKDLLGLDPLNEAYSLERVEPDRLHGAVLLVTPLEMDREILLAFLEETNLALKTAENIEEAVERAQKGSDLIIADYHIGSDTGPQLIDALREVGAEMPVVIMTSDKSETALDAIRDAEAAGILTKPISQERLLQALAEFLHADGDGGPLYSLLNQSDTTYTLVNKFLTEVPRMALNLEKALRENDIETCVPICRTLIGTASPLGFPSITTLATCADRKLAKGDLKIAAPEIRALIVACRRIKSKPAA